MRLETPAHPVDAGSILADTYNAKNPLILDDLLSLNLGGVGGNRTRVQEHSTDSSTYLVLPFNLILTTRTHTLRQNELPII